jgi:hypothetical protein
VKNTNLRTKFLLQIQKKREASAILLASNRPQHKDDNEQTDRKEKQNLKGKDSREKTKNKWAYKKLPTYKTLHKIILKTPKAEIPEREFYLLSDPLVLFRRIFKE